MRACKRTLAIAASLLLAGHTAARAQSQNATVSGIVTDSTGGVLPNARVMIVHKETGAQSETSSNERGFYLLRSLPIGRYDLEASLSGFDTFRRRDLQLTTAAVLGLDIQLQVGAGEVITVSGETPLLQARTSEIG